ncbi:hypothetical protein AG1IA_02381 [Rhizoctonia solani AG-1 IA]|uniref:Uncharacterized protein n=1 Tax=Thanatephorus cucumeris (strain AG1-IA) TaxID=983506 RepID=L8X4K9_THACA|nr:hypothetical protein AG1IA_02381 [Rhizoctonia solani AG-1 IA]
MDYITQGGHSRRNQKKIAREGPIPVQDLVRVRSQASGSFSLACGEERRRRCFALFHHVMLPTNDPFLQRGIHRQCPDNMYTNTLSDYLKIYPQLQAFRKSMCVHSKMGFKRRKQSRGNSSISPESRAASGLVWKIEWLTGQSNVIMYATACVSYWLFEFVIDCLISVDLVDTANRAAEARGDWNQPLRLRISNGEECPTLDGSGIDSVFEAWYLHVPDVPPGRMYVWRGLSEWVRFTFSWKAKEYDDKVKIVGSPEYEGME